MEPRGNITNSAPERRALRVNDFCTAYELSRSTAYKLIKEGKLRAVLIGGRCVIPVEAAEALLTEAAR